jgi:glycosyltransferase involved in cell wall biosynthesis
MRLCVVGPTYPYKGGISHFTTLFVEQLRTRHEVDFISYRRQYPRFLFPGNAGPDPSNHAIHTDCVYLLDPLNPITWLKCFRRIKRAKPDLLILQWWTPFWTPTLVLLGSLIKRYTQIPILYFCHHITPPDGGPLDLLFARTVLSRGDQFIVLSESDYADLRRALPQARIHAALLPTYGGVLPDSIGTAEARQQLGYGPDDRLLLFFGFVRRYKGLSHLLEALALVPAEVRAKLLVVGEFWEPEEGYRAQAEALGITGRVRLLNRYVPNEEVGLYFAAADVVVLPYLEATQSAVLQIAFGFETPVITTSVGGLPEMVRHGRLGIVVPPQDLRRDGPSLPGEYPR